jgi:ribosomal protein S18 acetylase RimI-like enzyme
MADIRIFEVTEVREEYVVAIGRLLMQLSTSQHIFTRESLQALVECATTHLFLMQVDGTIGGMLTLCSALSPTGRKVWVEDVVVDVALRGRSLGRRLVEHAIEYSSRYGKVTLMLTSRPSREAANALYRSSGFTLKETNVYKKSLPDG